MHSHIQINEYLLERVEAERNPRVASLVTVAFHEHQPNAQRVVADITAEDAVWQQVVDQLAAIGITPTIETTPVVPRLASVPDGAL